MKFTGERYISRDTDVQISLEHWHRYCMAGEYCKDKVVLDIASGEGYGSNYLSNFSKNVIGIDISNEAVFYAKNKYKKNNLSFLQGSLSYIPLKSKSVDIVVSFETIEHVDEDLQNKFLEEIRRILRNDGLFIVSTPDKYYYSDLINYKNEFHIKEFYFDEFRNFLGKYFKNTFFAYQKVFFNSLIYEDKNMDFKKYITVKSEGDFCSLPEDKLKDYTYIIALCSNSNEVKSLFPSINIDINNLLFQEIEKVWSCQLNIKSQELEYKSQELKSKNEELRRINEELNSKNQELTKIYNSHGWKLLKLLYKLENILIPINSKRRKLLKFLLNIFFSLLNYNKQRYERHHNNVENNYIRNNYIDEIEISIIIATYNRSQLLPKLIDAWRQVDKVTKYGYEIIFSDDGSVDNTIAILENVKDLPIVILKNKHGGAGNARNNAVKIARGKRIIFTGDDIFPEAEFVNKHYEFSLKFQDNIAILGQIKWHPDIPMNYLMYHITEVGCEQFSFKNLIPYDYTDFRHFYTSNISMDRKFLLEEKQIFRDDFYLYGFEDIELGYRLYQRGLKIYYVPDILTSHYHPYDFHGFCRRQESAGEMAVIFCQLHPDINNLLDVDNICKGYMTFTGNIKDKNAAIEKLSSLEETTVKYEKELLLNNISKKEKDIIKSKLSYLYSTLFKIYFGLGVLNKYLSNDNEKDYKAYLLNRFYTLFYSQVFIDTGKDFNEEESIKIPIVENKIDFEIDLTNYSVIKKIRFDPVNDYVILKIANISIVDGNNFIHNNIKYISNSFYQYNNIIFYKNNDPQIFLDINNIEEPKKLMVKMDFLILGEELYKKMCKFRIKNIVKKLLTTSLTIYRKINSIFKKCNNVNFIKQSKLKVSFAIYLDKEPLQEYINKFFYDFGNDNYIILPENNGYAVWKSYDKREIIDCLDNVTFDFVYNPESLSEEIDYNHLRNVFLLFNNLGVDFALISHSLNELPSIGLYKLRNQIIYSRKYGILFNDFIKNVNNSTGRFLRLLPGQPDIQLCDINQIFPDKHINFDENFIYIGNKKSLSRISRLIIKKTFIPPVKKEKKLIFVIPIFMAVGGVERNTIEIMRELKDKYHFVVITTEYLKLSQGSLHHQLRGITAAVYDLSELFPQIDFLTVLAQLKNVYRPDIIWICNGSTWLCDNAKNIRTLFKDVPIIDQQVYDVKLGWIERYHEEGIQSFDRFIAINKKIYNIFTTKLNMDSKKIDLIYSSINFNKISDFKSNPISKKDIYKKYLLPEDKNIYLFIGRMAEQKRPLDLLELILKRQKHNDMNSYFVLIGDGELSNTINNFISINNLLNIKRINFIENTMEILSIASGMIFVSGYEGLPIAMLEALAMGVPVLSTDVGDIRLILEEYGTGIIIPQIGDIDLYEKKFLEFVTLLPELKKNAMEKADEILTRFSSKNIANNYVECWEKVNK